MEIKIISKELIKPSSLTPPHQRTYKFSFLDQYNIYQYISLILFYQGPFHDFNQKYDVLKKSLAQVLTYFNECAGRFNGISTSVNCNDEGAEFMKAHIPSSIFEFLKQPNDESVLLNQLLSFNPYINPKQFTTASIPLFGVQANNFKCGGIAIGICLWHAVSDVSFMSTFLTSWVKSTLGANHIDHATFDCTSLFPLQDIGKFYNIMLRHIEASKTNIARRRFRFDAAKISALRDGISDGPYLKSPSRYEIVLSLIWATIITETKFSNYIMNNAVDLRRRMSPPLAANCSGNKSFVVAAEWHGSENKGTTTIDYNCLAGRIRESINKVDQKYIEVLGSTSLLKSAKEDGKRHENAKFMVCSSWCRYPFYECDFGWGKPVWVVTVQPLDDGIILMDTNDGQGIEAFVSLSNEDMAKFEQHQAIVSFSSNHPVF